MQLPMMKPAIFPSSFSSHKQEIHFRLFLWAALTVMICAPSIAAPDANIFKTINGQPDFLIDFGELEVGFVRTIGVGYSNVGGGPIANIEVGKLHGDDPQVFSIVQDNCSGLTLAPGQSCTLFFSFDPPAMADYSAELLVTSSAPASPELVRLIGTGVIDRIFSDRFQQLPPP